MRRLGRRLAILTEMETLTGWQMGTGWQTAIWKVMAMRMVIVTVSHWVTGWPTVTRMAKQTATGTCWR